MSQAQMARARMMGYSMGPQAKPISDKERDALKEKRKRERQRKKQQRKKR
jgi:signal recognition particle subunit SRP54